MPEQMTNDQFQALLEDLKTFGITDSEDIITITVKEHSIRLQVANVSNYDEIQASLRAEDFRGSNWIQMMRCEILARAVVMIGNVRVKDVPYAKNPYTQEREPTTRVLADMFSHWGQEATLVLWKVYMVHCQKQEDALLEQLPDAAITTEVERRYLMRIKEELEARTLDALQEAGSEVASETTGEE